MLSAVILLTCFRITQIKLGHGGRLPVAVLLLYQASDCGEVTAFVSGFPGENVCEQGSRREEKRDAQEGAHRLHFLYLQITSSESLLFI